MTEIKVIPKHIHPNTHATNHFLIAYKLIERRNRAENTTKIAEEELNKLKELRETLPRRNIFKRRRQRRALHSWLRRHGYNPKGADLAQKELEHKKTRTLERIDQNTKELKEVWLPAIRKAFIFLDKDTQERGDALLRKYAPASFIEGYDTQAALHGQTHNIIAWMGQEPSSEQPFGATDEQLEEIALWNADHAEAAARNPEATRELVDIYLEKIKRKAGTELHSDWQHAIPRIEHILIGDILDVRFLGYENRVRRGNYDPEAHALTIWPYELEGDSPLSAVLDHEVTHALGGFETWWINEGATQKINVIANDQNPNENDIYPNQCNTIDTLIEHSPTPLSFMDVSKYYLGADHQQNEWQLRDLLQQAYQGYDVLGALNNTYYRMLDYNKINEHYPEKRHQAAASVKNMARMITNYFEIAQKDRELVLTTLRKYKPVYRDTPILRSALEGTLAFFENGPRPQNA